MPKTAGSGCWACSAAPARILVSSGFTPLAWMRTSTWPAAACGRGSQVGVNAPLGAASTRACMLGAVGVDLTFSFVGLNSAASFYLSLLNEKPQD